jgi:hypothetical protein
MKKILIVETVDRLMPMFIKLTNEYFGSCNIFVLHISKNSFEIEEYNTKVVIKKGEFDLISDELTKLKIDFVCFDNYISLKNIQIINRIRKFKKVIFNIGLYLKHDKISYSYVRYGTINWFFVSLESFRLIIKHIFYILSIFKFDKIEAFFYGDATVVFWNKYSEINFKRDYPTVKTDNLFLFEKSNKFLKNNYSTSEFSRIIFAPSILGSKNKICTEAEFIFWSNLAKVMSFSNPNLHFYLSIHPMYSGKLDWFEFFNKKTKVFDDIFFGFDLENNNYDLLITDISSLYWIAPLYGLKSERVQNSFIHKKYFGNNEID